MATTIAQIGGFELWDILQLAQTSRMSIKLSVESPHGVGAMFFQGGNLVHAETGAAQGDDAVNTILDWREGSVSSSQLPENCPQTVRHTSIVALLMDRARQRDEASRNEPPPRSEPPARSEPAPRHDPPQRAANPPSPPPVPVIEKPQRAPPVTVPPLPPLPITTPSPVFPAAPNLASRDKELSDMDLKVVKAILEELDDHLMGGLISVDIISKASGMSLAGINSAPKACAMFNRLSEQLHTALTRSEDALAKGINKFIIEGDNGLLIFVIELDERHRWAILVDGVKAQLGWVFVIIPEIQPRLIAALKGR
ncbi:DUF4388 domain-containing protein [Nannocystis sp. SCPEA4]|uniref:DUF4388 domain-containing protein n=1 Tax=Nannocystis sp. SCPEA4 TaxID=2996787 RepID=UPI002271B2E7|nr:DUF4388 domain-containing protein [Nannocystis sp. SCPEA4]MCY1062514.1 DUF4388 domain-containing protein [Nannocystis sp. SCPEA4]